MASSIVTVELILPELPPQPLLEGRSWLLYGASSFHDLHSHFFMAEGIAKGESLGRLFEDIPPAADGSFQLELGACLPDLFPNLASTPEYSVDVAVEGKETRPVCLSNVMSRLRFVKEGQPLHAFVHRLALPHLGQGELDFIPKDASVELVRTMATCRYRVEGATAEEALERHLEGCIHDMIERLNRLLRVMPFVDMAVGRVYSVAYSRASFETFYFILMGADDKVGNGRISPHVGRAMLRPPDVAEDQVGLLRRLLDGSQAPDDIESLLHAARGFLDGGVLEYVLLLMVIAAEVATQRFVHAGLLASGVSQGKLKEAEKDMTYSMMANVVLFAVTATGQKPDKDLLGRMNRARGLRNEYMHKGERPKDPAEVASLLESTWQYVRYLREADAAAVPAAPGGPEA